MMDPEEAFDSFPASTRRRRRLGTFALVALVALVVALAVGALAYQSHRSREEVPATGPASPAVSSSAGNSLPKGVQLLDADQIRRLGDTQEWRVERTSDNTS